MKNRIIRFLLLFLFVFSLQSTSSLPQNNTLKAKDKACDKFKLLTDENLRTILYPPGDWVYENRTCVLNIMDFLADNYTDNNNFDAFLVLSSICNIAEGEISDYLIDLNGSFFYAKFEHYCNYLYFYRKNYKEEHCFVRYLITALSLQIAASKDKQTERQTLIDYINSESKKCKLNTNVKEYIFSIYERIDPSIWQ